MVNNYLQNLQNKKNKNNERNRSSKNKTKDNPKIKPKEKTETGPLLEFKNDFSFS